MLSSFINVNDRIPKIIHQVWLDKIEFDNAAPAKFQTTQFIDSFKTNNPDYQYMFWNNKKVCELFDTYPQIARWKKFFYETLQFHIEKCDVLRLLIMYCFGGAYFDLDMTCERSIDPVIEGRAFSIALDYHHGDEIVSLGAFKKDDPAIFNGFMASCANQPIWAKLLDYMMYTYTGSGLVMSTTGPFSIGRFFLIEGIYDELAYPELFMNRCYILPEGWMVSAEERKTVNCDGIEPVCHVNWEEGGSWQLLHSSYFIAFAIKRWHIYLLVFLIIAALGLYFVLRKRTNALKSCVIAETKCNAKLKKLN